MAWQQGRHGGLRLCSTGGGILCLGDLSRVPTLDCPTLPYGRGLNAVVLKQGCVVGTQ